MDSGRRTVVWELGWIVFCLLLAGCSAGAAPLRIASAPRPAENSPRRVAETVSISTRLVMAVDEPWSAAERAVALAREYGGRLVDRTDASEGVSLTLAAPERSREGLRRALLGLGRVVDEGVWDTHNICSRCPDEARIYLELRPKAWQEPPARWVAWEWSPLETFRSAWQVAGWLFTFLADGLIWGLVVLSPFLLIGLAVWALYKRYHLPPRH